LSIRSTSSRPAFRVPPTFHVPPLYTADILPVNTTPRTLAQPGSHPTTTSLPSLRILHTLLTAEGPSPLRSLYRGLTPNLVGNSLGWSLYFLWYSQAQDAVRQLRHYPKNTQLSSLDYLAASLASGILSAALTNPIWVIKTRMLSTSAHHTGAYPSMLFGLGAIAREEGWRGYFRGLIPTLAGVSHSAVYFVAYEKMKAERAAQIPSSSSSSSSSSPSTDANGGRPGSKLTNTDYLAISGASKILAGTLTYPHQVIRARMQTYTTSVSASPSTQPSITPEQPPRHTTNPTSSLQKTNSSLLGTIRSVWTQDGVLGFYRGLGPSLIRVVPSTCVTFLVYENVKWALMGGREVEERRGEKVAGL
jgi:solute carrier family 25 (mitochondrial folate transporter), member 32